MPDHRSGAQLFPLSQTFLGVGLAGPMGHSGIALALSLSAMVNLALLLMALRKRLGALGGRIIAASLSRTVFSSALMGYAVWVVSSRLVPSGAEGTAILLTGIVAGIATGLIVYGGLSYLMRTPELVRSVTWFRMRS